MKFRIGEQEYETVDEDQLTLSEAVLVHQATGLGYASFYLALQGDDPQALRAMVWLVRRRRGERDVTLDDVDFKLSDLHVERKEEEQEEPDPTATTSEEVSPSSSSSSG